MSAVKASALIARKRIPAQRSQAYQRWAPPDVVQGLVLRAEATRSERRPVQEENVQPWQRESLEHQLVENIRSGRFTAGVTARQLEAIVRDAARDGREDGYNQGFASGREEGFEQGRAEGLAAGRAFIEDAAARLSSLIGALQQPLRDQEAGLRESMLEIVERIARTVVRTELSLQPESIRTVIDEAIAALPVGASNIRVHLSPDDAQLMAEFAGASPDWTLTPDERLSRGDCRVESGESLVSYAVSERLEAVLAQLRPLRDELAGDVPE